LWHKTKCNYKWKLQVYNAIIVAQLTYGLNTLQLTPSLLARLDAFQMRGLRYILGIEHSYYSHTTNEEVYHKANIALNKGADLSLTWEEFIGANKIAQPKYVVKLSEYFMNQQSKALGHLIRADDNDMMKKVPINMNTMTQTKSSLAKTLRTTTYEMGRGKLQIPQTDLSVGVLTVLYKGPWMVRCSRAKTAQRFSL
jgi:hypothetical protein